MQFPLSFWDVSLWLAITAIILLATSELISPYYGKSKIVINKEKLRNAALVVGTLFVVTIIIRAYEIMASI